MPDSHTPFAALTQPTQVIRGTDSWGSGAFDAPRGDRQHRGIDIITTPGQEIYAPFSGTVVRQADPYEDDTSYTGCLLRRKSDGLEVKLFYMSDFSEGTLITAGQPIGIAQNIEKKYPGISNHIHLEVWEHDAPVDPNPYLA